MTRNIFRRLTLVKLHARCRGGANTRAWRNALRRAGIKNFRWHDLRHVWATWHVMAGTTMAELQELGAWKSGEMVRRYAHFAPEQLRAAADKLAVTASDGRASDAGLALVAWHRRVAEVHAARPLQQVAAGRRHVRRRKHQRSEWRFVTFDRNLVGRPIHARPARPRCRSPRVSLRVFPSV